MNMVTTEETRAILALCLLASFADGEKHARERDEIKRVAQNFPDGDAAHLATLYQDVLLQRTTLPGGEVRETSAKGLGTGQIGLLGAAVVGISVIAPAYTLAGALGPTVSAVGTHLPAIFLVGFIPMFLVAAGYRELNSAMPDSGTTFTWATKAFGPWIGWIGGWGLLAATVLVLRSWVGDWSLMVAWQRWAYLMGVIAAGGAAYGAVLLLAGLRPRHLRQ